jgi:hypothetical protein
MARSLIAAAVCLAAIGCGKKGPPLAPILRIPAAPAAMTATRLGSDVYVTLTIPTQNVDTSEPVSINRIDVYGYTGRTAPSLARWAFLADVVASVDVQPLPPEGQPPPPPGEHPLPGTAVTVHDTLDAQDLVQGRLDPVPVRQQRPAGELALPDPTLTLPLQRFYIAIAFSERGRAGPPGGQTAIPLTAVPDPPTDVRLAYTAAGTTIEWEPPGGLLGFVVDDRLPLETPPFDLITLPGVIASAAPVADNSLPPGPTRYNVYRELAPDPLAYPAIVPEGTTPAPMPVVSTAAGATSALDDVQFGRTRCYIVRAVRGTAIGDPAPPACGTPIDVFPPAAPAMPAAVAAESAISLIWDPNSELDLGGYLVLRREVGGDTLTQLTPTPIIEARYRDSTVTPGTRYIYTVIAVDSQLPLPNMSAESLPVEETAR